VIILYHLVFPDNAPRQTSNAGKVIRFSQFARQIEWLKNHYQIVALRDYLNAMPGNRKMAAITFDDGYKTTYNLIGPFLEKVGIPATFFANTSHLEDGNLLWFVYFNALCFENTYSEIEIKGEKYPLKSEKDRSLAWRKLIDNARKSGEAIAYSRNFAAKYPLPEEVNEKFIGLSAQQFSDIGKSQMLELGGHTHQHPYLDQLSFDDQYTEITRNKTILEQASGKAIDIFAYTGGVYNHNSIRAVKQAGFKAALAIAPLDLGAEKEFEIPRVDIYSPSVLKMVVKTSAWMQAYKNVKRVLHRTHE
jgi:peptidoglycan/xylan/chitin deacetylase (PgdA/CDA1 family)